MRSPPPDTSRTRAPRRTVAMVAGAGIAVLVLAAAAITAANFASQRIARNASQLHSTNSILGGMSVARVAVLQAVVFGIQVDVGVADPEALEVAAAEARSTVAALRDAVDARPADAPLGDLSTPIDEFLTRSDGILAALTTGQTADAEAVVPQLESSYRVATDALTVEQDEIAAQVAATEDVAGTVSLLLRILITFAIPTVAVLIYRALARRELREHRVRADAQLEAERALSSSKDEFIAGMSHELRTPLTGIYGFSEMLLEDASMVDPTQRELVGLINSESSELSRMVEDILTAARLEANALTFEEVDIELADEIEAITKLIERTGTSIAVECEPLTIVADPLRVRQVIRNLVSNAVKHGGPTIAVSATRKGPMAELIVADDGPGVPPEIEGHLFERYVHDGRRALLAGSVGLGLAIAKSLTDEMGGALAYRRRDDRTEFVALLPLSGAGPRPTAPRPEPETDPAPVPLPSSLSAEPSVATSDGDPWGIPCDR